MCGQTGAECLLANGFPQHGLALRTHDDKAKPMKSPHQYNRQIQTRSPYPIGVAPSVRAHREPDAENPPVRLDEGETCDGRWPIAPQSAHYST